MFCMSPAALFLNSSSISCPHCLILPVSLPRCLSYLFLKCISYLKGSVSFVAPLQPFLLQQLMITHCSIRNRVLFLIEDFIKSVPQKKSLKKCGGGCSWIYSMKQQFHVTVDKPESLPGTDWLSSCSGPALMAHHDLLPLFPIFKKKETFFAHT